MKKTNKTEKKEPNESKSLDSESKKESLTKDEEDYKTQMQRVQAEFENYRRRTDSERLDLKKIYLGNFIEKLIPILDHFELALKHTCDDTNYALGVEMIFKQFEDVLKSEGVSNIDILGNDFNPKFAEVISTKVIDGARDNEVIEVINKGYIIGDKVIRRSKVIVNKLPSNDAEVKESSNGSNKDIDESKEQNKENISVESEQDSAKN